MFAKGFSHWGTPKVVKYTAEKKRQIIHYVRDDNDASKMIVKYVI